MSIEFLTYITNSYPNDELSEINIVKEYNQLINKPEDYMYDEYRKRVILFNINYYGYIK